MNATTEARKYIVIFEREAPLFPSRVEELRAGHVSEDLAYWTSRIDTLNANGTIASSNLAA